jgi:AraC-like DNA-binding protein
MYFSDMAQVPPRYHLYSFPEHETPLGRVHFGGELPESAGTGWDGFRKYGMYAAVLITRGGGVYRDASGREIRLGEGSVIMVFPELPHHYGPGPGLRWDEIFVAFSGTAFDAWRAHGLDPAHPVWRLRNPRHEADCLRTLLTKPVENFGGAIRQAADVHAMLARWLSQRPDERGLPVWLEKARRTLTSLPEHRTTASVARECGLHIDAFRRAFRKWTGETPTQFRRRHRLAMAVDLLRRQEMSLSQIAEALGFHDAFHFSKCFKQAYGSPPSVFRKLPPTPPGEILRPCRQTAKPGAANRRKQHTPART